MTITKADIDVAPFRGDVHYNMGDKGYGYGFRCERYPRLRFIDRHHKPSRKHPDGLNTRTWCVDGIELESLTAALAALNQPVVLTDDEKAMLALIPDDWQSLRQVEDDIAGVDQPKGAIMPDTPHSRVLALMYQLRNKGVVEIGRKPERGDGEPWSDAVPEHMRWSPTVRKTPSQ